MSDSGAVYVGGVYLLTRNGGSELHTEVQRALASATTDLLMPRNSDRLAGWLAAAIGKSSTDANFHGWRIGFDFSIQTEAPAIDWPLIDIGMGQIRFVRAGRSAAEHDDDPFAVWSLCAFIRETQQAITAIYTQPDTADVDMVMCEGCEDYGAPADGEGCVQCALTPLCADCARDHVRCQDDDAAAGWY